MPNLSDLFGSIGRIASNISRTKNTSYGGSNFDINGFRSTITNNNEYLHTNRFLVRFSTPNRMINLNMGDGIGTTYYCKNVALPGFGMLSSDVLRYGMGPMERKPHSVVLNDCMMQFYVDGNGTIRDYIYGWLKLIANPNMSKGLITSIDGQSPYEFSYKDEYSCTITISIFSQEGQEVNRIVLEDAYPNYMGDVYLDWQEKNSIMILPVTFTYRSWYDELYENKVNQVKSESAQVESNPDIVVIAKR